MVVLGVVKLLQDGGVRQSRGRGAVPLLPDRGEEYQIEEKQQWLREDPLKEG